MTIGMIDVSTPRAGDLAAGHGAGSAAVRGGAMRTGAFVVGSLLSVVAAALLFRHLGVVETGRYTTAMSLAAVVAGLTDLGLTTVGIRELTVLRGAKRDQFASNLLGLRLALTVVGVLIVSSFAYVAYGWLLGLGVLIASAGSLIQSTQTTLTVPLLANMRLGFVAALDFARYLSAASITIVLVLLGARLLAFLAVAAIAALVVLPPTVRLVRGDIPIRPSFDRVQWRALVGPVLSYSFAAVTATLYLRVAIVLVSLIADAHQLGYFSVSYRVVEGLLALPGLLIGAVFPIFARAANDDHVRLGYAFSRVFDVALIVGVWVSLSLLVGSSLAIELIAGPRFHPAVAVLAVQGLSIAAVFVGSASANCLLSLHLHRAILILNLALLIVMAMVVAALASVFGAIGAAIGATSVEIVAAIAGRIVLAHGRPHLKASLGALPKVAAAAVIATAPAFASDIPIVGRVALSTCLYFAVLFALKALPADLPDLLLPSRRKL
jgi:O-antigen/teichoic acid export membrane protein